MALYNPGDRVIVRPDIQSGIRYTMRDDKEYRDVVTHEMEELAGQVVTIRMADIGGYYIHEDRWHWTDDMFSGKAVELDDPSIGSTSGLFE